MVYNVLDFIMMQCCLLACIHPIQTQSCCCCCYYCCCLCEFTNYRWIASTDKNILTLQPSVMKPYWLIITEVSELPDYKTHRHILGHCNIYQQRYETSNHNKTLFFFQVRSFRMLAPAAANSQDRKWRSM